MAQNSKIEWQKPDRRGVRWYEGEKYTAAYKPFEVEGASLAEWTISWFRDDAECVCCNVGVSLREARRLCTSQIRKFIEEDEANQ